MKTRVEGACVIWTGALAGHGYGSMRVAGRTHYAHRWIYEQVTGQRPLVVMHSCDNRACVALQHLSAGTHLLNTRDMYQKGRAHPPPHPTKGDHPRAKLTTAQMTEVARRDIDGEPTDAVAFEFGITRRHVNRITRRAKAEL